MSELIHSSLLRSSSEEIRPGNLTPEVAQRLAECFDSEAFLSTEDGQWYSIDESEEYGDEKESPFDGIPLTARLSRALHEYKAC